MLDFYLACAHHLLMFGIFGLLLAEFVLLGSAFDQARVARIARLDLLYGLFAVLVIIVGFSRATFAAKGWSYYSHNGFFWAKIATFALIGLISIKPTVTFLRWKRSGLLPQAAAVGAARRVLHVELALFILLPLFAAAMARGYGEF